MFPLDVGTYIMNLSVVFDLGRFFVKRSLSLPKRFYYFTDSNALKLCNHCQFIRKYCGALFKKRPSGNVFVQNIDYLLGLIKYSTLNGKRA